MNASFAERPICFTFVPAAWTRVVARRVRDGRLAVMEGGRREDDELVGLGLALAEVQ